MRCVYLLAATSFRFGRPGIQLVNSRGFDQTPCVAFSSLFIFILRHLRRVFSFFRCAAPASVIYIYTQGAQHAGSGFPGAGLTAHTSPFCMSWHFANRAPSFTGLPLLGLCSWEVWGPPFGQHSQEVLPEGECGEVAPSIPHSVTFVHMHDTTCSRCTVFHSIRSVILWLKRYLARGKRATPLLHSQYKALTTC